MPRDGAGNYSLPESPFVPDTVIESTPVNSDFSDLASAIASSVSKDGQTVMTGALQMGAHKIVNLQAGTDDADAVRVDQVATLARPGTVTFEDYGAAGDGVTNDAVACQAALDSGAKLVLGKPGATYLTNSTLTIPSGVALDGQIFLPGNPALGTQIIGGSAVSPVIDLTAGTANGTASLKNMTIGRVTGTPNSARIGVRVFDGYNQQLENVLADNHGICWQIQGHPSGGYGLGVQLNNCHSSRAVDVHIDLDSFAEVYWNGGRIGRNGSGDYQGTAHVRIRGGVAATAGGPNTIKFDRVQFNEGTGGINYWLQYITLGSGGIPSIDATVFNFTDCHVEGPDTAIITSDSSWNIIDRFTMTGCTVNAPSTPMFSLNAATQPAHWDLLGNKLYVSTFTLAPTNGFVAFNIHGGYINGTMSLTGLTGSTASIHGLGHGGNATLTGVWGALDYIGCYFTAGSLTNTATGVLNIFGANQQQGTWTPLVAINGSTTGITQSVSAGYYQLTGRIMTVSFSITLTSKGSGTGNVTITGLPVAEFGSGGSGGGALSHFLNTVGVTGTVIANNSAGSTILNVYQTTATEIAVMTDGNISNTTVLKGTLSYFVR